MSKWTPENPKKANEVVEKHLAKNHPNNRARVARCMVSAQVVKSSNEIEYMFSPDIEDELEIYTTAHPIKN